MVYTRKVPFDVSVLGITGIPRGTTGSRDYTCGGYSIQTHKLESLPGELLMQVTKGEYKYSLMTFTG